MLFNKDDFFYWKGCYEMHILRWDATLNSRKFVRVVFDNTTKY